MIRQDIDVNGYWTIIIVYNVYLGHLNTGFTYTDFNRKRSIVGISKASNPEEFFDTAIHELKHVQSHICKYYDVDEDSEEAAYLTGFIAKNMYGILKKFISTGI